MTGLGHNSAGDLRGFMESVEERVAYVAERLPLCFGHDSHTTHRAMYIAARLLGMDYEVARFALSPILINKPGYVTSRVGDIDWMMVGFVYECEPEPSQGIYKIGFSTRPFQRLVEHEQRLGVKMKLTGLKVGTMLDELVEHCRARSRHVSGEWFSREQVFMQEPRDEGEGQARAGEHGRGEGSQPRLPSDPAENKPDAPAVVAGANSSSSVPESLQAETKADVIPLPVASATPFQAEYSNEGDGHEVTEHKTRTLEGGAPEVAAPPPSATGGGTHGKQTGGERVEVKRTPLRPHCRNPNLCAGSGREHCWSCRKALAESEAA